MGKASRRKRMRRAEFLSKVAACDPAQFSIEWTKRLESWSRELRRDPMNTRTLAGSTLLRYANEQLAACGPSAVEAEGNATREILTHHFATGLACAVADRSYRLTNTGQVLRRSDLYVGATKKPPRKPTP